LARATIRLSRIQSHASPTILSSTQIGKKNDVI
jgi:hypothetical protein